MRMRRWVIAVLTFALLVGGCSGAQPGGQAPEVEEDYSPDRFAAWAVPVQSVFTGIEGVYLLGRDHEAKQVVLHVRTQEAVERVEEARLQAGLPEHVIRVVAEPGLLSEKQPLAGCQVDDPPRPEPDGVWLEVDPQALQAGDPFAFMVAGLSADAGHVTRGVDSYLECWDGTTWSPRYILYADRGNGPFVQLHGPAIIDAVGLGGPGPEQVVLPDTLEPGWYRLRKEFSVTGEDGTTQKEAFAYVQVES